MEYNSSYQCLKSMTDGQVDLSWFLERIDNYNHLEAKKSISYESITAHNIAMPQSQCFADRRGLLQLMKQPKPFVVKFDTPVTLGLQTVVVQEPKDLMTVFSVADKIGSHSGLVQQFVQGYEFTVTVLVGKHNWVHLGTALDYKKQFENDTGPNTFGMGSLSPAPQQHRDAHQLVNSIVQMYQQQENYMGFLSCQFIANSTGIWLLECNTRFCDPEFQSMAELLDDSFVVALQQCQSGQYIEQPKINSNKNAVTVSIVHQGWPNYVELSDLVLESSRFRIWRNTHPSNIWWGTVTNSGTATYQELARELYQWLEKQNLGPYRYRLDIGQV